MGSSETIFDNLLTPSSSEFWYENHNLDGPL